MLEFSNLPFALLLGALWVAYTVFWERRQRPNVEYGFSSFGHYFQSQKGIKIWTCHKLKYIKAFSGILLLIALAGPRMGRDNTMHQNEGIAMHLLLDRSGSMKEGMSYRGGYHTRLSVVLDVVRKFILNKDETASRQPNDLITISTFAGFYEENSPFTFNHKELSVLFDNILPAEKHEDGTHIGDSLNQAVLRYNALAESNNGEIFTNIKSRVIILLTDGEESPGGLMAPLEAAQNAKIGGIRVYTILIKKVDNFFGFAIRGDDGNELLSEIAKITDGGYAKVDSGEQLLEVYNKITDLEKSRIEKQVFVYEELFYPFLLSGSLMFFLYLLLRFFYASRLP